jgi:CHAT domain-containing protein
VVPDKILNQLPYAALILPESGHFLIQDYSLIFAPSSTMFVISSAAATAKEKVQVEKLLSVGDPAFDRQVYPLPYLPSARREAETVSGFYLQPETITGKQVTKQRLTNEIERFDILHMALHYVVDKRSPMRSKLLLAKAENGSNEIVDETDDVLQACEIYRLPLKRLRLVVLAACLSGVERYYSGEGMIGISRSFIAKGVPLVVASLWDVDSAATTELMTRFHAYRKQNNLSSAEALRKAQLSMLNGQDILYRQPYYWASFECIGGYAKF